MTAEKQIEENNRWEQERLAPEVMARRGGQSEQINEIVNVIDEIAAPGRSHTAGRREGHSGCAERRLRDRRQSRSGIGLHFPLLSCQSLG